jgi:hypothetical protein
MPKNIRGILPSMANDVIRGGVIMRIERFHFPLKDKGYQNHIRDSAVIISESIRLVLEEEKKPFLKVIALQLRLLLCDEDPLILRGGNTELKLAPITNKMVSYNDNMVVAVDPNEVFDDVVRNLDLSDWLEQKIMTVNVPVTLPIEITCRECETKVDVEKESTGMILDITDKVILKYKCNCISKFRDYDVTAKTESEEGTSQQITQVNYTIKNIIKDYSNKNGGAHIKEKIKFDDFFGIHLASDYIVPIALYVLGEILVDK